MQNKATRYGYIIPLLKRRLAMVVMLYLAIATTACAQSNAYNISDDLYKMFQKAYAMRKSAKSIALADSMYHKAENMNDKKAQCMALSVKLLHYYTNIDTKEALFHKTLKELQAKALKTGYIQYYYWGSTYQVNNLINRNSLTEVLDYIKKNQEFAKKHNHIYGIYSSYQSLGRANFQHGGTLQAIKDFKDALNFGTKFLPDQDMTTKHRLLAQCYRVLGDYQQMYNELQQGLKSAKTQQTRKNLLPLQCIAWFALGYDKEFLDNYHEAVKITGFNENDTAVIYSQQGLGLLMLKTFKATIDGDYKTAEHLLTKMSPFAEQCRMYVLYYKKRDNYKKATEWQYRLIKNNYRFMEDLYVDDFNQMYAHLNNLRLSNAKQQTNIKNTKLELLNTQLTVKNSSLELQQTRNNDHLSQLKAYNLQLSLNNKNLEAKQLRDSLAKQRILHETKEQELEVRNTINIGLLIVAGIIISISLLYIYNVKRYTKKLNLSNRHLRKNIDELFITKDKALQADKMKTMFIQNMSHEIRTPLNAIVGFSQILVDMGEGLDNDEKKEMCDSILHNSELLTTLINDILDLTSLESGKYVMIMKPVYATQICRQAIETVAHRKAPGVDLKLDLHVAEDYIVTTDAMRVKQVLINMLTNAEKNTSKGSITLSCSLHENPGMLTFSVADTGIGIPKDQMEKIFERFKKLNQYKQGFGLGLNICRMIAEKLGGKIYIDKDYTNGARFLFAIPVDK